MDPCHPTGPLCSFAHERFGLEHFSRCDLLGQNRLPTRRMRMHRATPSILDVIPVLAGAFLLASVATGLGATAAQATQSERLLPMDYGIYALEQADCSTAPSAAILRYDREGLSGSKQRCRTEPVSGQPDVYRLKCWDFRSYNPNKPPDDTVELTVRPLTKRSMTVDDERYKYCSGLRSEK